MSSGETKHCAFNGCKSDSRYGDPVEFIRFPKPCLAVRKRLLIGDKKHIKDCCLCAKSSKWIELCKRTDGRFNNLLQVTYSKFICRKHFVSVQGPCNQYPDPLPADKVLEIRNRWTVAQTEALLNEYKKYPFLFMTSHPQYHDTALKHQCLSNIVQALQLVRSGVTLSDVESQWDNLTVKCANTETELQNTPNCGGDPKYEIWCYEKLAFVKEKVRSPSPHVKLEESDTEEYEQAAISHPVGNSWENAARDDTLASPSVGIKEEIPDSPSATGLKEDDDTQSSIYESDSKIKDENDIFGDFVATQLKKIADEDVRQETVFEIHQLLYNAIKAQKV